MKIFRAENGIEGVQPFFSGDNIWLTKYSFLIIKSSTGSVTTNQFESTH